MNEIVLNVNVTGGNQLAVSKVCILGVSVVLPTEYQLSTLNSMDFMIFERFFWVDFHFSTVEI